MGMKSKIWVMVLAWGIALWWAVKEADAQNLDIQNTSSSWAAVVQKSRDTYKQMAEELLAIDEKSIEKSERREHIAEVFTAIDWLGWDYTELKQKLDDDKRDTSLLVLKLSRTRLDNLITMIDSEEARDRWLAASARAKKTTDESIKKLAELTDHL